MRALWFVVGLHSYLSVMHPLRLAFSLPYSINFSVFNSSWLRRLSPVFSTFSLPTLPRCRGQLEWVCTVIGVVVAPVEKIDKLWASRWSQRMKGTWRMGPEILRAGLSSNLSRS